MINGFKCNESTLHQICEESLINWLQYFNQNKQIEKCDKDIIDLLFDNLINEYQMGDTFNCLKYLYENKSFDKYNIDHHNWYEIILKWNKQYIDFLINTGVDMRTEEFQEFELKTGCVWYATKSAWNLAIENNKIDFIKYFHDNNIVYDIEESWKIACNNLTKKGLS